MIKKKRGGREYYIRFYCWAPLLHGSKARKIIKQETCWRRVALDSEDKTFVGSGWVPSAVFDVQKWSCALVMVVVALSEKCCLKCCLVTALQSIWSKYRATGANKLPGGQTAQLSVQILTAWVDDDGTIRRLIRQIWQPYHFAYIPIQHTIHHIAPSAHNTSQ